MRLILAQPTEILLAINSLREQVYNKKPKHKYNFVIIDLTIYSSQKQTLIWWYIWMRFFIQKRGKWKQPTCHSIRGLVVLAAGEWSALGSASRGEEATIATWVFGNCTRLGFGSSCWAWASGLGSWGLGGRKGSWKLILGNKEKRFGRDSLGCASSVTAVSSPLLLIVQGMATGTTPWCWG